MIVFRLDPRSGIPAYLQVVNQVRHALRLGVFDSGDQLPTVKEVVSQVAINPNTVLKAYRELELEGLVEGRAGVGTFVLRRPSGQLRRHARISAQGAGQVDSSPPLGWPGHRASIDAFFRTGSTERTPWCGSAMSSHAALRH